MRGPSRDDPNVIVDDLFTPCSPGAPGAMKMTLTDVDGNNFLEPIVSMSDMMMSLITSKPSVNEADIRKLEDFAADIGHFY